MKIASMADSVAVLIVPGMGDWCRPQAGILEIADVFVVNKATGRRRRKRSATSGHDRPGRTVPRGLETADRHDHRHHQ